MIFWSEDQELIIQSHRLKKVILDYSHFTQKLLGSLEHNLIWGKSLRDVFVENYSKSSTITDFLKEIADEEKKLINKNNILYNEYWKDQKPYFDKFLTENRKFINLAKNYIS